jgi:hypothetical protein
MKDTSSAYMSSRSQCKERIQRLFSAFYFDVDCFEAVFGPRDSAFWSGTEIMRRFSGGGDSDRVMKKPDDCLADCHCLLQVLEEEYKGSAGALIARLYYDAFQSASLMVIRLERASLRRGDIGRE